MRIDIQTYSLLAFAVVLAAALEGCGKAPESKGASKGDGAVAVTTGSVTVKRVNRTVDVVGTLYGDEDATISAKVSGRVSEIFKDVGDRVTPGEPLAQIDPTDYKLAQRQKGLAVREVLSRLGLRELPGESFDANVVPTVQRSRLTADNAKAKLDRARQLHDQRPPLISDQDFADIDTAYSVARSDFDVQLLTAQSTVNEGRSKQAEFEIATQTLADTTLRAPLPLKGVAPTTAAAPTTSAATRESSAAERSAGSSYAVSARLVEVGEYVSVGAAIFKVVRDDPVKLRAAVPERFSAQIQAGQSVVIRVESYDEDFAGKVSRINPQVDAASRTFQVEVIASNVDRKLKPGAFARASVLTKVDPSALFVPANAVATFAGSNKVFTVADGKALAHAVEIGRREGDFVEIISGLDKSKPVVVNGVSRLATGVSVTEKAGKGQRSETTAPAGKE